MKKQLILIAALAISTMVYAQHGHGRKHESMSDRMKRELALNDSQTQIIKTIEGRYEEKSKALRADSSKSREDKLQSIKAMSQEKRVEIESVLTSEQKSKWEVQRKESFEKNKGKMEAAGQRYEQKMKTELGLSDDQFARVKEENDSFRKKLSEHRQSVESENNKAAFERLRSEHDAKLKAIMTSGQYSKWQEMKKDFHRKPHRLKQG